MRHSVFGSSHYNSGGGGGGGVISGVTDNYFCVCELHISVPNFCKHNGF